MNFTSSSSLRSHLICTSLIFYPLHVYVSYDQLHLQLLFDLRTPRSWSSLHLQYTLHYLHAHNSFCSSHIDSIH
jgi:hypothetical protein